MRWLITNLCLLGMAIAFLVHLILIAVLGEFFIREPNPIILGLEIAAMGGIIVFATLNLIGIIRR